MNGRRDQAFRPAGGKPESFWTGSGVPVFLFCVAALWFIGWPIIVWHGPGQLVIGIPVQFCWTGVIVGIALLNKRARVRCARETEE